MAFVKFAFICSIFLASAFAAKAPPKAAEQQASDWETNAERIIQECQEKIPAGSTEAFSEFQRDVTANVSDKNVKCFVKCVGENLGLVDAKTGKLNAANLQKKPPQFLDVAKLKDGVKECGKISSKDACETATKQYQCLMKTSAKA